MTPLDLVLSRLEQKQTSGDGWKSRCPAHDDRNPSLQVWETEDGGCGLKCYAGCDRDAVLAAVGLDWRDLQPTRSDHLATATKPSHPRKKRSDAATKPAADRRTDPGRAFETFEDAVAFLKLGEPSLWWPYHDAAGNEVARVLRWDTAAGKTIRPVVRDGDGWRIGSLDVPRPLYRLPDVLTADVVFIAEGEKAADAVRSLGLVATTSPHGAESAANADWSPLAGKDVVVLPDRDEPGEKYAAAVRDILVDLDPPPTIKVLRLPGLPIKGDAFDWLEQRDAADIEPLRTEFQDLAKAAPEFVRDDVDDDESLGWVPFPLESLPTPLGEFVRRAGRALDVDEAFVVLPLLAMFAAAIGNSRRISLKPGWTEPACLWGALIGESGDGKSHPLDLALKAFRKRQELKFKEFDQAHQAWEAAQLEHERQVGNFKRGKLDEPPTRPEEPTPIRFIVDDSTVEALAPILQANFRGVLLAKDELAGLFGSFDRYAAGKGGDAAKWLEMFGGRSMTIDRKLAKKPTYVRSALVSIIGGIQPGVLKRMLSPEHRENGLAARFLFVLPPRRQRRWQRDGIGHDDEQLIARILDRLLELQPRNDENDDPQSIIVHLSPEAQSLWEAFYNAHAEEQVELSGEISAAWSKLLGYAARLSLVVTLIRWALNDPAVIAGENPPPWWQLQVDADSLKTGIALAKWFGHEAKRVYNRFHETPEDERTRELIEWITRRGGTTTVRDITRGPRCYRRQADLAERDLERLRGQGVGHWVTIPSDPTIGGRPTQQFRLRDSPRGDETPT